MDHTVHNKLVSFIWSIADDCLRDVYVRGKYRDVILPMVVLRRLDCLLEPTKDAVMEEVRFQRDEVGLTSWIRKGLRDASGYVFYNTSDFTLTKLAQTATNNRQILEANFTGLSRRLQRQCQGDRRQVPAAAAGAPYGAEGCAARRAGEVYLALYQPHAPSKRRPGWPQNAAADQPGHGLCLRRADPQVQRREQRRGGRAFHPA